MLVPLAGTWIEIQMIAGDFNLRVGVPLAGTWIEIHCCCNSHTLDPGVPLAGTWIEIPTSSPEYIGM